MSNNSSELDDIRRRILKLEDIFEIINKLTVQIEKLALETKYMREDYNDIDSRVMVLEQKPVKRYDTAVTAIITGLIGIVIGVITTLLK
jgi:hypothetical protein